MRSITEFMKIASMADANGLVLSPHGQQQVHTVVVKADTVRVEVPKEVVINVVPELDTLKMETSSLM